MTCPVKCLHIILNMEGGMSPVRSTKSNNIRAPVSAVDLVNKRQLRFIQEVKVLLLRCVHDPGSPFGDTQRAP